MITLITGTILVFNFQENEKVSYLYCVETAQKTNNKKARKALYQIYGYWNPDSQDRVKNVLQQRVYPF
ncbi:MAG: hypothetical protein K0U47_08580 [Epsilonproteobacteria bacterium]|nr:hypothetical protein [Campylobacterota bacterium]